MFEVGFSCFQKADSFERNFFTNYTTLKINHIQCSYQIPLNKNNRMGLSKFQMLLNSYLKQMQSLSIFTGHLCTLMVYTVCLITCLFI